MGENREKPKVNWLQVVAVVVPVAVILVTGWISMQVKVAKLEAAVENSDMKELKEEIRDLKGEPKSHIEREDVKRSDMWKAIARKKDKPITPDPE